MSVAAAPVAQAAAARTGAAAATRAPVGERLAHYKAQGLTEGQANTRMISEGYTLEDLAKHQRAGDKPAKKTAPAKKKTEPAKPAPAAAEPAPAPEQTKGGDAEPARDRGRPPSSSPSMDMSTPAGALLAIVCYPAVLAFIKGGPDGLKQWLRAKFLNLTEQTTAAELAARGAGAYLATRPIYTGGALARAGIPASPSADPTAAAAAGVAGTSGAAAGAIAFARAQIGEPYVWGANGPNSWDCSSLTQKAYASVGIKLPRTTYQQVLKGTKVTKAQLQPGDLVFANPGHVAIYTGGGKVVEAPRSGKNVREVPMWGFWTARRVVGQ